jgi:hypothetical protein
LGEEQMSLVNSTDAEVEVIPTKGVETEESNAEKTKKRKLKSKIVRKRKNPAHKNSCDLTVSDIESFLFPYLRTELSAEVKLSLSNQMGFVPLTLVDIAYSDPADSHAIVIKLYPLNNSLLFGEEKPENFEDRQLKLPFPTLYWLACPVTFSKIAQLEHDGWVPILNQRLLESEEALAIMKRAHELYAQERWDLVSPEDKEYVEAKGWINRVKTVGIAGIRDFQKVKCLHCHYAHYLGKPEHNNIIGKWVEELLLQKNSQK